MPTVIATIVEVLMVADWLDMIEKKIKSAMSRADILPIGYH